MTHRSAGVVAALWIAGAALGSRALAQADAEGGQRGDASATPHAGPALNWTREPGAESCIASVELAQRVEQRLGRPLFVAAPNAIVAIEGYVAPARGGGFRAELTVSDGRGKRYGIRELSTDRATPDCRSLDDALTLVIAVTLRPENGQLGGVELPEDVALALDALFGQEPTEPEADALAAGAARDTRTASPTTLPAATSTPSEAEPEPETPPPPKAGSRFGLVLRVHGFAQTGLQPGTGYGPAAAVGVTLPLVGELALGGGFSVRTTTGIEDAGASARLGTRVIFATLAWCPKSIAVSEATLALCANGLGGSVEVRASDFAAHNEGGARPLLAVGLGVRLDVPLAGPLSLSLGAGPALRVLRPRFRYVSQSGQPTALEGPARWGLSAEFGLSLEPL